MVDSVSFELTGLAPLLAKLDSVKDDVKYKGGRFALRKAANIVAAAAKKNALQIDDPVSAEIISKNVAIRWSSRTFKSTGDLGFRVGVLGGARTPAKDPRAAARRRARSGATSLDDLGEIAGKGKANPGGDTFYWRFVEFGTARSRAQPFMRRALSENITAATDEFIKQYEKGLDRAIKKAAKVGK